MSNDPNTNTQATSPADSSPAPAPAPEVATEHVADLTMEEAQPEERPAAAQVPTPPEATIDLEVAEPELPPLAYTTLPKSETVQQDFSISKPGTERDDGQLSSDMETLALPSSRADVEEANMQHPSVANLQAEPGMKWFGVIQNASVYRFERGTLNDAIDRVNSAWRQGLKLDNGGSLTYFAPKIADKEGVKLVGTNALMRMRAIMGMGGLVTIPLPHSGFHITIKTPSDSDYLNLREKNEQAKIRLGRMTFGMIYSGVSGYLVENIVKLIDDHRHSTTLKDADNIMSKISVLDLPILVWGLACAIWPKGFQYARSVVTGEAGVEPKVITGMIDVSKLLWFDNAGFTDRQRAHLSNRQQGQTTDDILETYRSQFISNAGAEIKIKDDLIKINLKVPSIQDYINSTHDWIEALAAIIDAAFTGDRTDHESRSASMMNHANLSRMRQYGHWVRSITMNDIEYGEPEEIAQMLTVLSEDEAVRTKYFDGIDDFINKSTVAVIGIPETSGKTTDLPAFPRIIPIDVVGTFFNLLMYRLTKSLPRMES